MRCTFTLQFCHILSSNFFFQGDGYHFLSACYKNKLIFIVPGLILTKPVAYYYFWHFRDEDIGLGDKSLATQTVTGGTGIGP